MTTHALTVRALTDIEADIRARKRNITLDVLAIGQDLIDAKAQMDHGAWLDWLRDMDFGQRTAENWMRLAREIQPGSSLAALPYTKALALLSAPEADREALAAKAGDHSAAELKRLAEEAREAKAEAARMRQDEKSARDALAKTQREKEALLDEIERIRKAPKVVEVAPEDYADLKDAVETLKQENDELAQAVEEAEQRAAAAWSAPRPEKKAADHLELLSAATDFLARVEMMPSADRELRDMDEAALRSMEITAGSIRAWADRMDKALQKARLNLHVIEGEGAVL